MIREGKGIGGKRKTSFPCEKKFSSSPRTPHLFSRKAGYFEVGMIYHLWLFSVPPSPAGQTAQDLRGLFSHKTMADKREISNNTNLLSNTNFSPCCDQREQPYPAFFEKWRGVRGEAKDFFSHGKKVFRLPPRFPHPLITNCLKKQG